MFSINNQLKYITTNWRKIIEDVIKEKTSNVDFNKKIKLLNDKINTVNFDILYPPFPLIFHAFNMFNSTELKIVILGQDPYHQKNQAMGLSFSVNNSIKKTPPSLKNIFKELNNDLNITRTEINLSDWAEQGILLLNSSLTVVDSNPNCHQKYWEFLTDIIIENISLKHNNIIFLLWGNHAKSKKKIIDCTKHYVLESVHPSPLSASKGWFGCKHFSKSNKILKTLNKSEINW